MNVDSERMKTVAREKMTESCRRGFPLEEKAAIMKGKGSARKSAADVQIRKSDQGG